MYTHALSTGVAVNSETKTSLSSISISDNSLENCKELATEYPLRFWSGERIRNPRFLFKFSYRFIFIHFYPSKTAVRAVESS